MTKAVAFIIGTIAILAALSSVVCGQHVLFFGHNGCQPCQEMKSIVAQLRQVEGRDIRYVDTLRDSSQTRQWAVSRVPTFVAVRKGFGEVHRCTGKIAIQRLRFLCDLAEGRSKREVHYDQQPKPYEGATIYYDNRVVRLCDGGTAAYCLMPNGEVGLVSCSHRTIDSRVAVGTRIGYECYDGRQGQCVVVAILPEQQFDGLVDCWRDAALYRLDRPPASDVRPLRLADRPSQRGEQLWIAGLPDGKYFCRTFNSLGEDQQGSLWGDCYTHPGDSGAPIINSQGCLVGVHNGQQDGYMSNCGHRGLSELLVMWGNCGSCDSSGCGISIGCGISAGGYSCPSQAYRGPRPTQQYPQQFARQHPQQVINSDTWRQKIESDIASLRSSKQDRGVTQKYVDQQIKAVCSVVEERLEVVHRDVKETQSLYQQLSERVGRSLQDASAGEAGCKKAIVNLDSRINVLQQRINSHVSSPEPQQGPAVGKIYAKVVPK